MSNYFEIKYAVKGKDDKTYWNRCGTAFPMKNGEGYNIILDAIPTATENGQLRLSMFPPKPKESGAQSQSQSRGSNELDDEIPF